jgi:hypothetical protein
VHMAGIVVAQTSPGVVGVIGAWVGFLQTTNSTSSTQTQIATSIGNLAATVTAAVSSGGAAGAFANVTGLASAATNLTTDYNNYSLAVTNNDQPGQDQYFQDMINDAVPVGGGIASAVQSVANLLGYTDTALAEIAGTIGEATNALGTAAGLAQLAIGAANGLADYLQQLENGIMNGVNDAIQQDDQIQLPMNDPSGDGEIVMPAWAARRHARSNPSEWECIRI